MAQIPSPIVVGQQRQPFAQQLIMALLSQAPGALMSLLNQRQAMKAANAPPQPTYAQEAEGRSALDFLFQQPPGQSRIIEGLQREPSLGDARKDFGPALKRARQVAPAEAKQILVQQEEAKQAAEGAKQAAEQAAADAKARSYLSGLEGGERLTRSYDFAREAQKAGMETSTLNDLLTRTLPETEREVVSRQLDAARLRELQGTAGADKFATAKLIERGLIPQGSPSIPGASKTLLALLEADQKRAADEAIDWAQEGLDFITNRVAGVNITLGGTTIPSLGRQIGVEDAIGEWLSMLEQYAPPEVHKAESARIRSQVYQRSITMAFATATAVQALQDPAQGEEAVKVAFRGAFTPGEIATIIADAKKKIGEGRLRR